MPGCVNSGEDYMQRKIPFKGIQPLPNRVGEPCQTKATTNEQIWIGQFHGPVLAFAADWAVKSPRRGRICFPVFIFSLRVQARCPGIMVPFFLIAPQYIFAADIIYYGGLLINICAVIAIYHS